MEKRLLVAITIPALSLFAKAAVLSLPQPHNSQTVSKVVASQDSVIKDLEDLESVMPDSFMQQKDTTHYGIPTPKGYDAMRFILDRRHRYAGDKFVSGNFWKHTYITVGGGISTYLPNSDFSYTPFSNLHVGVGKEFSPMSSLRLTLERGWGFTKASGTISSLTTYGAWGGHIDYLFNFTNYLMGYRPERPLNVSGVIGVGIQGAKLSATDNSTITNYALSSGIAYNARLGLQFRLATSPHAFVAFEPYARVGSRKQDMVEGTKFNSMDFSYGINLSYLWYFNPELSKSQDAGDFMRRFEDADRYYYDRYVRRHWRRPMFFDYNIGPVFYNKTELPMGDSKGYTANAYFGWWMSPAIGLRTGIHIANADWTDNSLVPNDGFRTKSLLGVRGGVLDFLFNPFGLKRDYDWDSNFGMNLFAGYELGKMRVVNREHNTHVKGNYVGYRIGSQFWMKLADDLRLTVEPSYIFIEQYQGFKERKQYDELGLKLGLSMLFRDKPSRDKFAQDSIGTKSVYNVPSGYFLGAGLGWNSTVHTWRYSNGSKPLLKNGLLFGGYRFDAYHGIRMNIEYITDPIPMVNATMNGIEDKVMRNTLLSLDYQLSLTNAIAGYNPYRRWNAYIYGGPSLALGSAGTDFALNFGGMLTYNITPNLSLFYNHSVYRMPKDRYITSQIYKNEGTFVNSLSVGMLYHFNRSLWGEGGLLKSDYSHQPFFFEYNVGPVWYDNVNLSLASTLGYTSNAYVGWWLNSTVGLRGGIHISNADWARDMVEPRKYQLGFNAGTLDLLFNPLGLTRKYDWNAPAGFNILAGAGLGKIRFVNGRTTAYEGRFNEWRLGAQFWLRMAEGLRFNIEPTYSMMRNFSGDKILDNANELALKVGISMLLRDRNAENTGSDDILNGAKKADYMPNGFFFGGGLGWNTAVYTWHPTGQSHNLLKNGVLFGGYRFDDYHGMRLSGEYLTDKVWDNAGGGNMVSLNFKNTLLSLDYQFNILNVMTGVNPFRRWGASLYTGPSLAMGSKGTEFAWNFGGILSYNITRNLAMFYSHTIYRMSKDRYDTPQVYRTPGTVVNSINVGLMYNLAGTSGYGSGLPVCDYSRQPLFFEYSVGPAWYNHVSLSPASTLGYTANAYVGWWLNSAIGLRGGIHISNADWQRDDTEARKHQLGFTAGTLDFVFNPLGLVRNYDWNAPFGLNVFAGGGLGKVRFVTGRTTAYEGRFNEIRLGMQLWMRLVDNLRLTLEPTYSMMRGFSGTKVLDKADEMAIKLGFSMLLHDRSTETKKDTGIDGDDEGKFFVGGGIGWNTTAHTWHYAGQSGSLLKNGLLFAGYNVDEYHAIRLGAEYLTDKVSEKDMAGDMKSIEFKNTLLSLDYQFNLLNAIAGIKSGRRWGASLFLGPSLAMGKAGTELAWNFGGILSYKLNKDLSLFYNHAIYRMSKDRYASIQVYRTPGTVVNSLSIGLCYNLFSSSKK